MNERSPARQSVTVEIAGERHSLRSDASPEYTQAVAAHLDATIRNLGMGNTLDPHKSAILAALTITDELFRAREEVSRLRAQLTERAGWITQRLERALSVTLPGDSGPPEG